MDCDWGRVGLSPTIGGVWVALNRGDVVLGPYKSKSYTEALDAAAMEAGHRCYLAAPGASVDAYLSLLAAEGAWEGLGAPA